MFSVTYGSKRRESSIRRIAVRDKTTAVILASVHFEWMLKRTILKLSQSPTATIRRELEDVYKLNGGSGHNGYAGIWGREIACRLPNAALGRVIGRLTAIQNHALRVRGRIVHGNGTVSDADADKAIDLFLQAGKKLREFAASHAVDIDARLSPRRRQGN
jgi:hypothetical protein